MRIDVLSVFPDYFAPLHLSVIGRALRQGQVELHVQDLRDFTSDRHRTVDDTPYGGGPGMVMSPEPWGRALDVTLADTLSDVGHSDSVVVVPTPSGRPFRQADAQELATHDHLLFACGRYEGIDARVVEHYSERIQVRELSIGDYVLAGGEAATLVMVEAIVRLLTGVLGNDDSAGDDSFGPDRAGAALEGPQYTRPRQWRGLSVPDVLLSGDHARIARWREAESERRTSEYRPDLLEPGGPRV